MDEELAGILPVISIASDEGTYALVMGGSLLLCCVLFCLAAKGRMKLGAGKTALMGGLTLVFSTVFGLVGAKLLYFVFRCSYILKNGFGEYVLSLKPAEMSYYGGMAGVCLAAVLSARIAGGKRSSGKALNAFAAPGALLAALARFAEYWLGYLGTGDYIEEPLPFPFAVTDVINPDFPEFYYAVFMLAGVLYLRVAVFAVQNRKDPLCFVRVVFYLCLAQILCESMRAQSIRWLFVRYEQLLCYLVAEGILVWYAFTRLRGGKRNWGAAVLGFVVCLLTIAEEFMLDGKISLTDYGLPAVLIHIVMAWGLMEMGAAESQARKRLDFAEG